MSEKVVQFPKRQEEQGLDSEQLRVFKLYERCDKEFGPGVIGIVCGEQGRWSDFTMAISYLIKTRGTLTLFDPGVDITRQCNSFIRATRERGDEWLWIIGDDHLFDGDIILRLLSHDLDVVVPNVLQRSAPFYPVIYQGIREEDGHHMLKFDLPETGVHEIFAAGSAGMLIRKRVLDELPEQPFQRWGHLQNKDLEFCKLVREAGFTLWCDADTHMAHKGSMNVWPEWSDEYGWGAKVEVGPPSPDSGGKPISTNFFRLSPGSPAMRPG